jgi:quinol monooxygenase YgiN
MPDLPRRDAVLAFAALAVGACSVNPPPAREPAMYGLIGKMIAVPGQRDALVAILLKGIDGMPGCLSYVVAHDAAEPDALWITEVWASQEHHRGSHRCARPSRWASRSSQASATTRPRVRSVGSGWLRRQALPRRQPRTPA